MYFFYLTEQHCQFLLHTLQVLYMCTVCDSTDINTIIKFVSNWQVVKIPTIISNNPVYWLSLTFRPNVNYNWRTAPLNFKVAFYIFNKYKYRIFLTWHILSFFFSWKCSLFHNSNLFGSCIIHSLYTECAKFKKLYFRRQKVNLGAWMHRGTFRVVTCHRNLCLIV